MNTAGTRSPTLPRLPESVEPTHQPDSPGRVSAVRRRLHYLIRWTYYVWVHRGFRHAAWACAHEGTIW